VRREIDGKENIDPPLFKNTNKMKKKKKKIKIKNWKKPLPRWRSPGMCWGLPPSFYSDPGRRRRRRRKGNVGLRPFG